MRRSRSRLPMTILVALGAGCAATSQRSAPRAARPAVSSPRALALARPANIEPPLPTPSAAFEAWLTASGEKSVHLATQDGRCEHMVLWVRTSPAIEGRIAPHMMQSGVAVFSFYFEYAEGRLTLRDPEVARYAGSSPHASLASCEHSMVLTSANADAFSWSYGRWYRSAAACEAAVARRDAGAIHHGRCEHQLARVRALAVQPDVLRASSPLLSVARAHRAVFRLSEAQHDPDTVASSAGAAECVAWSFRPDVRGGERGALRASWASEDGARGYTEYGYELGANTIMLLGPRSTITRQPRSGGMGSSSLGCEETKFVDVGVDGVISAAGEPWFLSREACETARRAATSSQPDASETLASRPRARHDC